MCVEVCTLRQEVCRCVKVAHLCRVDPNLKIFRANKSLNDSYKACRHELYAAWYTQISNGKIWNIWLWKGSFALRLIISFFIITFDWNGNFEFRLLHRKDLVQFYQKISYYISKKYFFIYKNQFLGKKWKILGFFMQFFLSVSFIPVSYIYVEKSICWSIFIRT